MIEQIIKIKYSTNKKKSVAETLSFLSISELTDTTTFLRSLTVLEADYSTTIFVTNELLLSQRTNFNKDRVGCTLDSKSLEIQMKPAGS